MCIAIKECFPCFFGNNIYLRAVAVAEEADHAQMGKLKYEIIIPMV